MKFQVAMAVLAASVVTGLGTNAAAAQAAGAPAGATALAAVTAPASPASKTSDSARALRSDVAAMLQDYINAYGDRFTPSERKQLLSYRTDADRQLAAVVLATRRLEQAKAFNASLAVRKARGAAAQSAWRRAKSTADTSFASARQIMEPRLSVFEKLSAANDYNTMMGRFDDLGAQIDDAAGTVR